MKIAIFYHLYQTQISTLIYQQQMHRLYTSGLLDHAEFLHIGISGSYELFSVPKKAKIQYNEFTGDEGGTVISMMEFCRENPDYKILFFHAKGASKEYVPQLQAWRLFMEYYVIDQWKTCISCLNKYNSVGVKLRYKPVPHFSGNFWWANSDYLNTCDHRLLYTKYFESKVDREFWIGTGKNFNPIDLHSVPEDLSMHGTIYNEDYYVIG